MSLRVVLLGSAAGLLVFTACTLTQKSDTLSFMRPTHIVIPEPNQPDVAAAGAYLKARIAESRGDLESAAVFYKQSAAITGKDEALNEAAFTTLLANGNVEDAIAVLKKMDGIQEIPPLGHILLAAEAVKNGDYVTARVHVDKATETSPRLLHFKLMSMYLDFAEGRPVADIQVDLAGFKQHDVLLPQKLFHMGRIYERAGDDVNAREAYIASLAQDSSSLFTVLRLGAVLEKNGDAETAVEMYHQFNLNNPDSVLLDYTMKRLDKGQAPEDIQASLNADMAEVFFSFATLMVSQGMDLAGRQLMHMADYLDPAYPFTNFYLGIVEEQSQRPEKAIEYYSKIKKGERAYLAAQVRIAESKFSRAQKTDAVDMLLTLTQERPELPLVTRALAEMYYDMNNYPKAIEQFAILLDALEEPERHHAVLYFARGASFERLGQYDEAAVDLQKAISLEPNNPMALNYLGYMWVNQNKNIDEAFDYIKKAVLLKPNDGSIIDSLGWAYYRMGEYEKAVSFLERAVELEPTDPTINAHLGDVYEKLHRYPEARLQWERALSFNPESAEEKARLRGKINGTETADSLH